MAERCALCSWVIEDNEKTISCQKCGSKYHAGCWSHMKKCYECGAPTSGEQAPEGENDDIGYIFNKNAKGLHIGEKGLFANIGEKLKDIARVITILGIVFGIITCVAFALIDEEMILVGIISGVGEAVVAWISALIVYAFGELVQNSKESKKIQQEILNELKNKKE